MANNTNYYTYDASELRRLIIENPDLPLLMLSTTEDDYSNYSFQLRANVFADICEVLDCEQDVDPSRIFIGREDFEDALSDKLADENPELSDAEFKELVAKTLQEYEPYWKKAIGVFVS